MQPGILATFRDAFTTVLGPRFWPRVRVFVGLLVTFFTLRSCVGDWNEVPSQSMVPAILPGDRIWVNKLAYDLKLPFTTIHLLAWSDPTRGEVIVFFSPKDGTRLVKRVIAGPGDPIDGVPLPPGKYFVMGDNRDHSADSRVFGPVDRSLIIGRSSRVLWSFDPDAWFGFRAERFCKSVSR